MRTYWKVICKMRSCWAPKKANVKYRLNKWVKAPNWLAKKGYHLFIFRTMRDALCFTSWAFQETEICAELYKCHAKHVTKRLPLPLEYKALEHGKYITFWGKFPEGTLMAKEVMLIERVKT